MHGPSSLFAINKGKTHRIARTGVENAKIVSGSVEEPVTRRGSRERRQHMEGTKKSARSGGASVEEGEKNASFFIFFSLEP